MADLGMKLQAEHGPAAVANGGDGAGFRRGQRDKIALDRLHLVAVTHPYDGLLGHASEQAIHLLNAAMGPAEFSTGARFDLAAQDLAGQLHTVADAQGRDAEVEDGRIAFGSARLVNAGRAARED